MRQAPPEPVTGIVFRRVRSPSDREGASRLLADSGVPPAAVGGAGDTVLYGLWDLTAQTGEGLVGAAAMRPLDDAGAGSVELCGIAVRADLRRRGLGLRLVAEVADALRAEGAVRLVARLQGDYRPVAALLARAGFAATADGDRQSARTGVGWRYLAL
jgi:ribosomal protein S18 acetylase RimI-like enzyme